MSNASFQMNGVEVFSENAQTVTVKNINVDANDTTTPSMCKAWVNFNGILDENSGSLTVGENVLIRASYNVSSVYYNGTGDYTINFSTDMSDENYCFVGSGGRLTTNSISDISVSRVNESASNIRIETVRGATNVKTDFECINVSIFR